ncbi:hypothetical protein PHYC_01936 [Phycisphaerales bacterium]|nr:hypothetical protein PHYC_01936 [Phycisphaerales bacterium]
MARLSSSPFARTEDKVAWLLQRFPETRESDTWLAIRFWDHFNSSQLEDWDRKDLTILFDLEHFETLSRIRRHLQNTLSLFAASLETQRRRGIGQSLFDDFLAAHRAGDDEVRFYIDETRAGPHSNFFGIGGICVANWRQWEKHHHGIVSGRKEMSWQETIRFADIQDNNDEALRRYERLLSLVGQRKGGLLFVGYSLPMHGSSDRLLVSLFVSLINDALDRLRQQGCIRKPSRLVVCKEAEEGWDNLHLAILRDELTHLVPARSGGLVHLKEVIALPKGREPMLEVADLIAGAMQRRATRKGTGYKDRLVDAVANVTGFTDRSEQGALFHHFA